MKHCNHFSLLIAGVALLLLFLLPAGLSAQPDFRQPGHFFSFAAELLKVADQRLYLWLPQAAPVNADFTIGCSGDTDLLLTCGVDEVAERVVVSESLGDSLAGIVEAADRLEAFIFLDATRFSTRPLAIGAPSAFAEDIEAIGDLLGAPLQNDRVYFGYDDLKEAQVELALGGLDLLLLPANEVDDNTRCHYQTCLTDWRVEWYLATDLPDYDLLPAALSYCIKGALADSTSQLSSVILADDAARHFPASEANAASLFEQMPVDQARRNIGCGVASSYPATLSFLRRRINNCGGSVTVAEHDADLPLRLLPVVTQGDSLHSFALALAQLHERLKATGFSWAPQLDDKQLSPVELSRKLSRELKLIPLGSQPLVLLTRPEVHEVDGRFYLVEP